MSNPKKNKQGFQFVGFNLPKPRLWHNVGCLMDIPTGVLQTGSKGETIINGGFGPIMGIAGVANSYKSTLAHYFSLTFLDRLKQSEVWGQLLTYDTEAHANPESLNRFLKNFPHITPNAATELGSEWLVTCKTSDNSSGNEWLRILEENLENKKKDQDSNIEVPCFKEPYVDGPYKTKIPTIIEIDSFTEFEPESNVKTLSGDLDSKDTNTYAMKVGGFKTKVMGILPRLSSISNNYFIITYHFGNQIKMDLNPYAPDPVKKLQFLKANEVIKGAGSKTDFLTSVLFVTYGATLLKNQTTKQAEYPKDENDKTETDLNYVRLLILRNKNGPSGITLGIIVSQTEGVLPTLSEFHFCKISDKFGIGGNDRSYFMELYPDTSLSRTTVRNKINTDPRLRRAINITAELLQLKLYHGLSLPKGLWCDAKTLYEDIKKLGYDWNTLLDTRGYWLIDQYTNPVPYLSTMDLLNMRAGKYKPYFIKDKK